MKAAKLETSIPSVYRPSLSSSYQVNTLYQELGPDDKRKLTPIGRKLAKLPIDPTAGLMLLQAEREGVVEQVIVIASALSIQDPRERPMGKEEAARAATSDLSIVNPISLRYLTFGNPLTKNLNG